MPWLSEADDLLRVAVQKGTLACALACSFSDSGALVAKKCNIVSLSSRGVFLNFWLTVGSL
jgi:hypothetical protein